MIIVISGNMQNVNLFTKYEVIYFENSDEKTPLDVTDDNREC